VFFLFRIPPDPNSPYVWIGLKGVLANIFLVQNLTTAPDIIGVLWSLPLEVEMYVILPFVYLLLRGSRTYRSLILWAFAIPVAILLPHVNWRFSIASYAPCFLAGVVAFDLLRSRKAGSIRLPRWVWPIGIGAAILLFGPFDNVSLVHRLYRAWLLSLFLAVLYVHVQEGKSGRFQGVFHWIAEHSYGIYLSHTLIAWIVLYPMARMPVWFRAVFFAGSMIGVPAVLYRYLERPLMLAGGHVSRRILHPLRSTST